MPRYRVTIAHVDKEKMLDLVRKFNVAILDHSQASKAGGYSVDAMLDSSDIPRLVQAGYQIQQHEDMDETGKARQKEIGQGNRYKR